MRRRFAFEPFGQFRQLEISGERLALAPARDTDDVADPLLEHDSEILSSQQVARTPMSDQRRGSDCRMAGEGQFALRGENPYARAVDGVPRLENEHRLGQIEFGGDRLHADVIEPFCVENDGERIAGQRRLGEHVEGLKSARHQSPAPRNTPLACERVVVNTESSQGPLRPGAETVSNGRLDSWQGHVVRQPIDAADARMSLGWP